MIAADTNLIVRHLTHDDVAQTAIVERLFREAEARGEPIFIGQVVLAEVSWALERVYGFAKTAIADAIRGLLDDAVFVVEDRTHAEEALAQYRRGRAEFADYLIGAAAHAAGASSTLTFDRKVSRSAGFTLAR